MATRKGLYDKKELSEALKGALEEISSKVAETKMSEKLSGLADESTKKPLEILNKFLAMNDEDKNKLAYDHEFKVLLDNIDKITSKLDNATTEMDKIVDGIQTKLGASDEERKNGIELSDKVIEAIRSFNESDAANNSKLVDDALRANIVSGLSSMDSSALNQSIQDLEKNIDDFGTPEDKVNNRDIVNLLKDISGQIDTAKRNSTSYGDKTLFVGREALGSKEYNEKYVEIENLNKQSKSLEDIIKNVNKEINNIKTERLLQGIKNVWGYAKKLADEWIKFNDLTFKVGRQMGMTYKQLQGMQTNFMRQTAELARLYGLTREELLKFQESYTSVTGRAVILSKAEVENMAALSKLVDESTMNDLVDNFDKFGTSTEVAMAYLEATQERAMKLGLNASKAASVFAKNMNLASKFTFREGVNGVSKMVMLSQKLRMNMESIAAAAEKFETIEGAITTSANLQVLGGSYANLFSNPMQVMFEATSDFESFQERIANVWGEKGVFNKRTGTVEISPIDKRMIKESAKSLGISYEEALTIAQKNVSSKYIENQLTNANSFSEEQKTAITNLAKYDARTGKHYITTVNENGVETNTNVSDLTPEALERAMVQANEQNDIDKNVWDISQNVKLLTRNGRLRANSQKTFKEELVGGAESIKANIALNEDGFMKGVDHFAKSVNTFDNAIGKMLYSRGTAGALMIGGGVLSFFGGAKGFGKYVAGTKTYQTLASKTSRMLTKMGLTKGLGKFGAIGLGLSALAASGYWLYNKSTKQFDNNLNGNNSVQQQEQGDIEELRSEVARQTEVDSEGNGLLASISKNTGMSAKLLELQAIEGGAPVSQASIGGSNIGGNAIGGAIAGGWLASAMQGAMKGAATGTLGGPWGIAAGAAVGLVAGIISDKYNKAQNDKLIQEENARKEARRQRMLEVLRTTSNSSSIYNSQDNNTQSVTIKAERATVYNDNANGFSSNVSKDSITSSNSSSISISKPSVSIKNDKNSLNTSKNTVLSIDNSPNVTIAFAGIQKLDIAPREYFSPSVLSKPTVGSESTVISNSTYWNNLASYNKFNDSKLSFKDNKINVDVNGTIKMQGSDGKSFDINNFTPRQKSEIAEFVLQYINKALHGGATNNPTANQAMNIIQNSSNF